MLTLGNQMTGLPQYLGGRWLRFEPGQLWAEADLASQTPTPPATWHGGAIAAILDHITGAVVRGEAHQGDRLVTAPQGTITVVGPASGLTCSTEIDVTRHTSHARSLALVRCTGCGAYFSVARAEVGE